MDVLIMRIWDIQPDIFCRNHLLGEHRELHAVWSVITNGKKAYANHPEITRWRGRLKALYLRHEELVQEMKARGYNHHTPLDPVLATGEGVQSIFVVPYDEQIRILLEKECGCKV
jgi:hypothetical protein